ncbi:hypothetical protein TNCV_6581 [Trichonephila clavipes]|nr:hypothetical protein TNCV_6581 [Trichonephila clavipes]
MSPGSDARTEYTGKSLYQLNPLVKARFHNYDRRQSNRSTIPIKTVTIIRNKGTLNFHIIPTRELRVSTGFNMNQHLYSKGLLRQEDSMAPLDCNITSHKLMTTHIHLMEQWGWSMIRGALAWHDVEDESITPSVVFVQEIMK